jgi:hypothetical protein
MTGYFVCKKGFKDNDNYFTIRKGCTYYCLKNVRLNYILVLNKFNIQFNFEEIDFFKFFYTDQEYTVLLRAKKLKKLNENCNRGC